MKVLFWGGIVLLYVGFYEIAAELNGSGIISQVIRGN